MSEKRSFKHVRYLWEDDVAGSLSGLDRLVYRSNKLGEDLTLTNTGGGNTSSKLIERDPLTGEDTEVLWVKGSGGDLRTATRDGFASLHLDKVRAMKPLYVNNPERASKTRCTRCIATASSISTRVPARSIHRFTHSCPLNTSIIFIPMQSLLLPRRSINDGFAKRFMATT